MVPLSYLYGWSWVESSGLMRRLQKKEKNIGKDEWDGEVENQKNDHQKFTMRFFWLASRRHLRMISVGMPPKTARLPWKMDEQCLPKKEGEGISSQKLNPSWPKWLAMAPKKNVLAMKYSKTFSVYLSGPPVIKLSGAPNFSLVYSVSLYHPWRRFP